MKAQKLGNIKWTLDDEELATVLKGLASGGEARRGYFSCDYKGRKIFIKFFREKGLSGSIRNKVSPRGEREYKAGKKLLDMSILTPMPLGYGISDAGSYIIQEHIDGGAFVDVFLAGDKRQELLLKLADLLRTLKARRVLHNDLHLNNVIVSNGNLYLIDLHKMVIKRNYGIEDEVSNLAHAVTMLYDDMTAEERDLFFTPYGTRGIQMRVENEMKRMWKRWIRKKKERAFNDTSIIIRRGDYVCMAGREGMADGDLIRLIKKDKKVTVERHSDHVRKIYRNRRRLQRAWETHVVLKYLNLSVTPEPFCVKNPSLFSSGYIAMEDLTGSGEELDRYLDRHYDHMAGHEKAALIEGLSGFFAMLFRKRVVHRDLKGCNIFVSMGRGFLLLDVEDISFSEIDAERLRRMLIQLNTTIPGRIRLWDRMRFYLKVVKGMDIDKKQVFEDVKDESAATEIVYEGVGGLRNEVWGDTVYPPAARQGKGDPD